MSLSETWEALVSHVIVDRGRLNVCHCSWSSHAVKLPTARLHDRWLSDREMWYTVWETCGPFRPVSDSDRRLMKGALVRPGYKVGGCNILFEC